MINSWTAVWPSSMLTTADMVGRSVGDGLVHNRATFIIFNASSLLKLDFKFGSTKLKNVNKGKEEGRTFKGYFGHVVKCAILYALLTL